MKNKNRSGEETRESLVIHCTLDIHNLSSYVL